MTVTVVTIILHVAVTTGVPVIARVVSMALITICLLSHTDHMPATVIVTVIVTTMAASITPYQPSATSTQT